MYSRILVPLDGSPRAEAALPVAARLARASGGTLVLTRIVTVNPELSPYFVVPMGSAPQPTYDAMEDAKAYLSRVREDPRVRDVSVESAVFVGMTASGLLEAIGQTKSDLVVMCSHGRSGFARWALGSVAQHIARHAPVPVLVLRDSKPVLGIESAEHSRPMRALVSLDGSRLAEAVLTPTLALLAIVGTEQGSELHLATVVSLFEVDIAGIAVPQAVEAAQRYLDDVVGWIRNGDFGDVNAQITIATHVEVSQDIAGTLIRMAEREPASSDSTSNGLSDTAPDEYDLMALATHGRSGVALWAVGSITERVLQSTQLPLLIVRPKAVSKGEAMEKHAALHESQKLEEEISTWPGLL